MNDRSRLDITCKYEAIEIIRYNNTMIFDPEKRGYEIEILSMQYINSTIPNSEVYLTKNGYIIKWNKN